MATEVFHMDANGVRISVDRAVFANHTYATRNISSVAAIADRGVRWPGTFTMALGFVLLLGGFVFSHTFTMILGVGGVLSGSLNLSRKRPKYGVRIFTQRGPVYVLASQDKQYVDTVSTALQRAMSAARKARSSSEHSRAPSRHPREGGDLGIGVPSPTDSPPSVTPAPPPAIPASPPVIPTLAETAPPSSADEDGGQGGPPSAIPAPPSHPRRPQRFRKRRRR